jgi:hypothetical protein
MLFRNDGLRFLLLTAALAAANVSTFSAPRAATFIVVNNDSAGVGFNDTTSVAPVGGNTGTTLGQQRLIAFQFAANIWGSLVASNVAIRVGASFAPLSCNASSAILGSAGPNNFYRDFTGAPIAGTWYPVALANSLHGSDLDSTDDIGAQFNGGIGTTCPTNITWYYGLDGKATGNQIDFITVLVHELGHGLGFLTLVDDTTGAKALGFNDTFMLSLENHGASPPDYPSMTNAQRVAASTTTGNLHWVGANARAWSGILTAGTVGDHIRMYAPNPFVSGSSVSHWDTVLTPNQVMEPSYTEGLHHPVMELPLFRDLGWTLLKATHDFDGDGRSDIVWRDGSGHIALWLMNGAAVSSATAVATMPSTWAIAAQRNFSRADVKYDFLWRDTGGNNAIWFMNGGVVSSATTVGNVPTNWSVAATADFNGDGVGDILWRDGSGNLAVWLMTDSTVSASAVIGAVPSSWTVVGAGDFNNDGRADLLWRDTGGNTAIWFMNGTSLLSSVGIGNVPTTWSVVGTGDFNADARTDIVWRDTGGNTSVWLMSGASVLQAVGLGNVPTTWSIVQTGDYNSDGKADLLWRDTGGNTAIWFMNGAAVASTGNVGNVPATWTVQTVLPVNSN